MSPTDKRILIVANPTKADAERISQQLRDAGLQSGWSAEVTTTFPLPSDALEEISLCIVIGGDGSLLGVVEAVAHNPVPVMGVNLGTLGFMANFSAETAVAQLQAFIAKPYPPSPRRLLRITTPRNETHWALNDVVIRATGSRLARLSVQADGSFINAFYADGLIFATPTGSTAYNLSAGGPLLHPDARAMAMTPINPHSLTSRAIVLHEEVTLSVEMHPADTPLQVSTDGRSLSDGEEAFPLKIQICPDCYFPLLQPESTSHFDLLRKKLRWMGETPSRLQNEET